MADIYSDNITNIIAEPVVVLDRQIGVVKKVVDTRALSIAEINGDVVHFGPIPSNAKVTSIKIYNDDLDSGTDLGVAIGLAYGINNIVNGVRKNIGDTLDADAISAGYFGLQAADKTGTELRFNRLDINTIGDELWSLGGLSEDCGGDLVIVIQAVAGGAGTQAGDISLDIEYII